VEGQLGSAEFVEQRRASLERWLQQLAAHPVIGASDVRNLLMRPPTRMRYHMQTSLLAKLDSRVGSHSVISGSVTSSDALLKANTCVTLALPWTRSHLLLGLVGCPEG